MIRILLAHPSRLVCDSLRTALNREDEVYVVGCATTAEELQFLLPHSNVVLLGIELKDATAFDVLEDIRQNYPEIKALLVGVSHRPEVIVQYLEAGARGYILSNESVDDMVQKLKAAHENKALVSSRVAAAIMNRLTHLVNLDASLAYTEVRGDQLEELTPRQQEVLSLIHEGYTNQEIAEKLVIECGTVKNHVHSILKKLEVSTRHEAATVYQMHNRATSQKQIMA
jgi:DNA-binding NarL/FixJ family response regulator